jgi:hypothetical protein
MKKQSTMRVLRVLSEEIAAGTRFRPELQELLAELEHDPEVKAYLREDTEDYAAAKRGLTALRKAGGHTIPHEQIKRQLG